MQAFLCTYAYCNRNSEIDIYFIDFQPINGNKVKLRHKYVLNCLLNQFEQPRVGRCGVVGSTYTRFRIHIGHGFESEHRLFSHHGASDFSKLRSLAKCPLDDSVRRLR